MDRIKDLTDLMRVHSTEISQHFINVILDGSQGIETMNRLDVINRSNILLHIIADYSQACVNNILANYVEITRIFMDTDVDGNKNQVGRVIFTIDRKTYSGNREKLVEVAMKVKNVRDVRQSIVDIVEQLEINHSKVIKFCDGIDNIY